MSVTKYSLGRVKSWDTNVISFNFSLDIFYGYLNKRIYVNWEALKILNAWIQAAKQIVKPDYFNFMKP